MTSWLKLATLNVKRKIGSNKLLLPVIELINQASAVIKLDAQPKP